MTTAKDLHAVLRRCRGSGRAPAPGPQIDRAPRLQGPSFYRERLDQAGVKPGDLKTLDDLKKLPFTSPEALRDQYPFPFRAVPYEQIVRIHASSGTTGKRKILC